MVNIQKSVAANQHPYNYHRHHYNTYYDVVEITVLKF